MNTVYVVTRIDNDDETDTIIGVYGSKDSLIIGMEEEFEKFGGFINIELEGNNIIGEDPDNNFKRVPIAYVTNCIVQ